MSATGARAAPGPDGPTLRVGLAGGIHEARLELRGRFLAGGGRVLEPGAYAARREGGEVVLSGATPARVAGALRLSPSEPGTCRVTVHDVTIGVDFHWQRRESQQFEGALVCALQGPGLALVNELPLEAYLVSVVSSEMRASCPPELLRAHAVVSRSWLLAQLEPWRSRARAAPAPAARPAPRPEERIRWYDRESHDGFDVCADDHCQRYQGIGKAFAPEAEGAVRATRGLALVHAGAVCDARYSKCCGGKTEVFAAAWEQRDVPYLQAVYDGPGPAPGPAAALDVEAHAAAWITSAPEAYCRRSDPEFLARVLPGFDQETRDFYRWEVAYTQDELAGLVQARLGCDLGRILALEPLQRGGSGRIVRLLLRGERDSLVIGKELEIRRALSPSHLYSSAFVVTAGAADASGVPAGFRLRGAGWGHGVGLCQIGAASMADRGRGHREILSHYFRGAELSPVY